MLQILVGAAHEVVENIDQWDDDWKGVSHLYAGAVRQLSLGGPTAGDPYPCFPELAEMDSTEPLKKKSRLIGIANGIIRGPQGAADLIQTSRSVICDFGRPLYNRLNWLIENGTLEKDEKLIVRDCCARYDDFILTNPMVLPPSFIVTIDKRSYTLVPTSFCSSVHEFDENSLAHLLGPNFLPSCGWDVEMAKAVPPYVRVLDDHEWKSRIFFLDTIIPEANERLGMIDNRKGIGFASIPLHPSIPSDFEMISADSFRVIEAVNKEWKGDWQNHLSEAIIKCSEQKVAIACLPELMMSPKIQTVLMEALSRCKNCFPILVVAGSWHEDLIDGGFVNRMHLLCNDGPGNYKCILHHDKFEPFVFNMKSNGEQIPLSEGNEPGSGLTFLVTSIGIIAFGICKDLFIDKSAGVPIGAIQINEVLPTIGICPSMTGSVLSLFNTTLPAFKAARSIFVYSNSCGPVRTNFRGNICCAIENADNNHHDVRGFVAAPIKYYDCPKANGFGIAIQVNGLHIVKAECAGEHTTDNVVYARFQFTP